MIITAMSMAFTWSNTNLFLQNMFTEGIFQNWDDMGLPRLDQLLMMHAMIYRTTLLRDEVKLQLPHHTSYEDNLYVCVPLPYVKHIRYLNEDLYRYFIGRPDQSVNLSSLVKKVDNQLLVTREFLHAFDWENLEPPRLRRYIVRHFIRLVAMCILPLSIRGQAEDKAKLDALWDEIEAVDEDLYRKVRTHPFPLGQILLHKLGPDTRERVYRWIGKTWRFN